MIPTMQSGVSQPSERPEELMTRRDRAPLRLADADGARKEQSATIYV
jgi:hypothetical protein